MALQSSGQISLNDMHLEVGGSTGTQVSLNDSDIRGLIDKASGAQNSFNEYYGASAMPSTYTLPALDAADKINAQNHYPKITVSTYIASGGTLTIPQNYWVWSDDTSTPALTIDIPCTIENNGYIYGAGGDGGGTTNVSTTAPTAADNAGEDGGDAIKINSGVSNVTINNNSTGIIGGGGGGGGGASKGPLHSDSDYYTKAGGGGGAGGGNGQSSYRKNDDLFLAGGTGASLNGKGTDGAYSGGIGLDTGGALGGGGGISVSANASFGRAVGGGGGGFRPLYVPTSTNLDGDGAQDGGTSNPQLVGGDGGKYEYNNTGDGGVGVAAGFGGVAGGGGGGWGGAGGDGIGGVNGAGGAAGKAIEDSGNTYTLVNNNVIHGATT